MKNRFFTHVRFASLASYVNYFIQALLYCLVFLFVPSYAAVITVPGDYSTIQGAIDAASEGDEIIVSPGTYVENIHFKGKNVILRSTDPTNPSVVENTIINGNHAGSVVTFAGTETDTCMLSGFTITNGYAQEGAGIMGNDSHATIQNNRIISNTVTYYHGGGLSHCDGTIQHNTISDNSGMYCSGGGLYACDGLIQHNTISNNSVALHGGGLYFCNGTIRDNTISNNRADNKGGGIWGGNALIQNNTISDNSANYGGGVSNCKGTILNNTISGNSTVFYGGGLEECSGNVLNNVIFGNTGASGGGGLYKCNGLLQNNTIADNYGSSGGGVYLCKGIIRNCIIWGNSGLYGPNHYLSATPSYSCVQDWVSGSRGNITFAPLFVDPSGGDYHLQPGSPCIDAGNTFYLFGDYIIDIDGECRVASSSVDIGADEYNSSSDSDGDLLSDNDETTLGTNPDVSDTDGDGLIDGVEIMRGTSPSVFDTPSGIFIPGNYPSIQEGIFKAFPLEEITVAQGTYYEQLHFLGKSIIVQSTNPENENIIDTTIIDGETTYSMIWFSGEETEDCFLRGFTICHGRADFSGGGIYGQGTLATIENNKITTNSASQDGGGICHCNGTIQNNFISANTARKGGGLSGCGGLIQNNIIIRNITNYGGGLHDCDGTIRYNTISFNTATDPDGPYEYGGGLDGCDGTIEFNTITYNVAQASAGGLLDCDGLIKNNNISNNKANHNGGGLYNCVGTIQDNTISNNRANQGGGLYACDGVIQGNTITGNTSASHGGGFYLCNAIIQNNTIIGNSAGGNGGGIWGGDNICQNNIVARNSANWGGGLYSHDGIIRNNTIYGNSATGYAGGLFFCKGTIINCIIWANSASAYSQLCNSSVPSYSCIQDWTGGGTGNITDDPLLVDPSGDDFHLDVRSPCIDAGGNIDGLSQDFEGDPRPFDGSPEPRGDGSDFDIGADEFVIKTYLAVFSEYDTPVPPAGINFITSGSVVTAYMSEPIINESGTRHICTGWLGEGAVPDSGTSISVTFVLDQPSTITWQWQTQYYLDATTSPPESGTVTLIDGITIATGWYAPNEHFGIRAVPASGYEFDSWSGDLSGSANPEYITMDTPKSIVANFSLIPTPTPIPVVHYTFNSGTEGWEFAGEIPPFDMPASTYTGGALGLYPSFSTNCFSYWYSPDVAIENGKLYRSTWTIGSTVTSPDSAVQFRLRVNQKGAWSAWERIVNSNNARAPSSGNNKDYPVFFDPRVTGMSDNLVVFNFDILSFDPADDINSWILLDELIVDEVEYATDTVVASYNFTADSEGWAFAGTISPYDEPNSSVIPDYIGLSPEGSTNCFSYWLSPDITIEDEKIYRARWRLVSTASDADDSVQFRLRANQKGAWQAWNRVVNSNYQNAPALGSPKDYYFILNPDVTGTDDNLLVLSFDILSFDPADDTNSWLFLDKVDVEKLTLIP